MARTSQSKHVGVGPSHVVAIRGAEITIQHSEIGDWLLKNIFRKTESKNIGWDGRRNFQTPKHRINIKLSISLYLNSQFFLLNSYNFNFLRHLCNASHYFEMDTWISFLQVSPYFRYRKINSSTHYPSNFYNSFCYIWKSQSFFQQHLTPTWVTITVFIDS